MAVDLIAGLGVFKTLYDSAKALKDINDTTVRNGAVVELGEKILAAQAAQMALLQRVGDLEKEVASFERWEAQKERYELKATPGGGFAYALKPNAEPPEPPHQICAACYEHRKRSVLQKIAKNKASTHMGVPNMYRCPECKAEILA